MKIQVNINLHFVNQCHIVFATGVFTWGWISFDKRFFISYFDTMNKKRVNTLNAIFSDPVRSDILWNDIEKLIVACGGYIEEGRGSRVRMELNGVRAVFHRPHPEKETDKGALKSVRRFLSNAGITL